MTELAGPPLAAGHQGRRARMTALCAGVALMNAAMAVGSTAATLSASGRLGMTWASVPNTVAIAGTGAGTILLTKVRRFLLGYLAACGGAALAVWAVASQNMLALTGALAMLGLGNAAAQLSRYAAAGEYPTAGRGVAIGLVVWAAAIGAVGGPLLLGAVGSLTGAFLLAVACCAAAALVSAVPRRRPRLAAAPRVRLDALLRERAARPALASMVTGQVVMVAVMTVTPMDMRLHGSGLGPVGLVLSAHTLGMFALSPLTGRWCDRYGARPVMLAGLLTLMVSTGFVAVAAEHQAWLRAAALFLLGYAWNLCFLGGSSHLATRFPEPERTEIAGAVDAAVWTTAAVASLASTVVMAVTGYPALALSACALAGVIALAAGEARPARPSPGVHLPAPRIVEAEGRSQVNTPLREAGRARGGRGGGPAEGGNAAQQPPRD